jgi:ubiquinone/menaquinone biosynthesis C-methylase UbiE
MQAQTKGYKGMGMEGRIATWYAKNTRRDLAEFQGLAQRMAQGLAEGASVLEVAPGPGYFSIELAKRGHYQIKGIDISRTFVVIAKKNARTENVAVDFQLGDAARMPFEDSRFDLIVCRAAFKNFSAPVAALREMRRVLKPGGKALIIDLRKDTPKEAIDAYVDQTGMGRMDSLITKMTFRLMLIPRAYTRETFERFISESGFERTEIQTVPLGFEITLFK